MFYTFQTGTRGTGGYSIPSKNLCSILAVPEIVIQHIPDRYKRIFHPLQKLVEYSSNTRDSFFLIAEQS